MGLGSSVAGLTVLCYAVGFVADTGRWARLGVPQLEHVPQEYLITGAKFLGTLIGYAADGLVTEPDFPWIAAWPPRALLMLLALLIAIQAKRSPRSGSWLLLTTGELLLVSLLVHRHFISSDSFAGPSEGDAFHLGREATGLLFQSVEPPTRGDLEDTYATLALTFVVGSIAALFLIRTWRRRAEPADSPEARSGPRKESSRFRLAIEAVLSQIREIVPAMLSAVLILLLALALILLPLRFGDILIYKEFPIVTLAMRATESAPANPPVDGVLLRRERQGYLLCVWATSERPSDEGRLVVRWLSDSDVSHLSIVGNETVWRWRQQQISEAQSRPKEG